MKLLIFLLCSASILFGRIIIIEQEPVQSQGITFYVLTICKDGYQYTGYHKGELLDFKIIQDFEENIKDLQSSPVKCMMDFKDESQLDK